MTFPYVRTGLSGEPGSGKTGLVRQPTRELTSIPGAIALKGAVAYLPQDLPIRYVRPMAALLGIEEQLTPLPAIAGASAVPTLESAPVNVPLVYPPSGVAPALLLLDEPTNDLDPASTGDLTRALYGYRGDSRHIQHRGAVVVSSRSI